MIQTILFASDMGPHTPYLLHHVNAMAAHQKARVIVVHAIEPPGCLADAVVRSFLAMDDDLKLEEDPLTPIVEGVKSRIVDLLEDEFIDGQRGLSRIRDVKVVAGKAADVILEEAGNNGADLIIIGSHGTSTEQPNLLGSVTSRVLSLSRVPVYMVPLVRNLGLKALAG